MEEYNNNIGKKVKKCHIRVKHDRAHRQKFKSGNYVNTVKGVIDHPILHIPAYTFLEDDSYVECRRCEVVSMKTHKVIDLVYHEDEGNEVYCGTLQECEDWKSQQGFGYQVVPMTKEEIKLVNEIYNS